MKKLMLFGEHLLKTRKKLKLTVEELATKCGVSRSYITLIENNNRLPSKKLIPIFALALGLKTNILVNWYLEDLRDKFKDLQ